MKIIKFKTLFIATVFFTLCYSSCSRNEEIISLDEKKEYVDVSFNIGGEYPITVFQEPMTKSNLREDLYAVQVHYYTNENKLEPYAYAIFNNPDNITLRLIKGYTYKFETMICVDGYNKLQYCGRSYINGFQEQKVLPTKDENFTYTERYLSLVNSRLDIKGESETFFWTNLSLYRNILDNVVVSEESTPIINFEMEYITGKLRFIATNLTSGYIRTNGLIKPVVLTPTNPIYENLYAQGTYATSSTIDIYYVDEDDMQQLIGKVNIGDITPKVTTIIKINIENKEDSNKTNSELGFIIDEFESIEYPEGETIIINKT